MNPILTIIKKQLKDTLKNIAVLIQFVMFPILAIIMTQAVRIDDMPPNFFVILFSTMYVGMAPLSSMSSIIAEEKEQNTLRVLRMAKVSPFQYLLGIGSYVLTACALGSVVFCLLLTGMTAAEKGCHLLLMLLGIVASGILGAAIGIGCKDQMTATSISLPVMMLFSFLPMLSMFNDTIREVARFTYSEQLRLLLNGIGTSGDHLFSGVVLTCNIALFLAVFLVLYHRKGLE